MTRGEQTTEVCNDASVQVMEGQGWKLANKSKQPAQEESGDEASKQRALEDAGAKEATAAQLKTALTSLGISFPANAAKADLLALFLNRS